MVAREGSSCYHGCLLYSMPYCSLAMALDVLSTGTYPRLPLAIKEKIVLPPSLTQEEQVMAFGMLEGAIRRRMLKEGIPEAMVTLRIKNGMVTFIVPYEFEVLYCMVNVALIDAMAGLNVSYE